MGIHFFFPVCGLPLFFAFPRLEDLKSYILMKFHLPFFSPGQSLWCALQGKSASPEVAKVCSHVSTWVFPSPSFILRSMIHLELIFVDGVRKGLVFFFFSHIHAEEIFLCQRSTGFVFVGLVVESLLFPATSTRPPRPRHPDVCGFPGSGGAGSDSSSARLFQDGSSFPGPVAL